MVERFVQYQGSKLHYQIFGTGKQPLLFFHGFGQDSTVFKAVFEPLQAAYTVYAFDLYFHGKSTWAMGDQPMEKSTWKETLEVFFKQEDVRQFSIAGFSLGARFALTTFECFPEQTSRIFLLAPDGITINFWYRLATGTSVFRSLFKNIVRDHQRFLQIVRAFRSIGLISEPLARFAEKQMMSEVLRNRVYYSWVVFRKLKVKTTALAKTMNERGTPVTIVMGEYDKVISPESVKPLSPQLKRVRIRKVNTGHHGIMEQAIPYFLDGWE
ncbi:MAG TPA: alpha/beta hydrolase [Chryseolinea sp.]|nr:alpha/beta hydrolase [Chryseolinea sp.]